MCHGASIALDVPRLFPTFDFPNPNLAVTVRVSEMEIVTLPEDAGGAALDETARALFQLQSQALKAAQAQVDASQTQIDASLAQIDALQQQIDALRRGSHDACDTRALQP